MDPGEIDDQDDWKEGATAKKAKGAGEKSGEGNMWIKMMIWWWTIPQDTYEIIIDSSTTGASYIYKKKGFAKQGIG